MKLIIYLMYISSAFAIGKDEVINNICYNISYIVPYKSDEDGKKLKLSEIDIFDTKPNHQIKRSLERAKLDDSETKKKIQIRKKVYSDIATEFNKKIDILDRDNFFSPFGTFEITGISIDVQDFDYNSPTDEVAADLFYCIKYTIVRSKLHEFLKWKSKSPFERGFSPPPAL